MRIVAIQRQPWQGYVVQEVSPHPNRSAKGTTITSGRESASLGTSLATARLLCVVDSASLTNLRSITPCPTHAGIRRTIHSTWQIARHSTAETRSSFTV